MQYILTIIGIGLIVASLTLAINRQEDVKTLEMQLQDTYSAINILINYQYQMERNIALGVDTLQIITSTDIEKENIIWAKSVLNSVGKQQGFSNIGTYIQPCY